MSIVLKNAGLEMAYPQRYKVAGGEVL